MKSLDRVMGLALMGLLTHKVTFTEVTFTEVTWAMHLQVKEETPNDMNLWVGAMYNCSYLATGWTHTISHNHTKKALSLIWEQWSFDTASHITQTSISTTIQCRAICFPVKVVVQRHLQFCRCHRTQNPGLSEFWHHCHIWWAYSSLPSTALIFWNSCGLQNALGSRNWRLGVWSEQQSIRGLSNCDQLISAVHLNAKKIALLKGRRLITHQSGWAGSLQDVNLLIPCNSLYKQSVTLQS